MKMRIKILLPVIALVIVAIASILTLQPREKPEPKVNKNPQETDTPTKSVKVIAKNLKIPWDIAFLPDRTMLVTERPGNLLHIEENRTIPVEGVAHVGEGGLLGIALHPNFKQNNYVYLYQTTRTSNGLTNRVVRYTYVNNKLTQNKVIIENLPGAPYHDGGRIRFGPDEKLWITIGDAGTPSSAQNPNILGGSILRLNPDGTIPESNPFGNAVYSYGHRNPQGLAWDEQGRLWSTEHGRSGARSGMDEINLIHKSGNHGWPDIEGDETAPDQISPKAHSGPNVTWAPASALYWQGNLFFGGLRGQALYEAVINNTEVVDVKRHFHERFGRIRSVTEGPDGMLYITTSNRDGRGNPTPNDDRIIRIHPDSFTNSD